MGAHVNLVRCVLFLSAAPLFTQAKVEFFGNENFLASLYTAERITTSCETLPRSWQNEVNSIKTDSCIILYSNEFCVGSFIQVDSGEHPSLPYSKNQVESYRACTDVSKDEPWRDVRIKLYLHYRSNEMLWDTPITPECVTLPKEFRNEASSVSADLCVILFSEPNCIGEQYKIESVGYDKDLWDFNDDTQSFMPCNASDVYKRTSNKSVSTQVNIQSRAEFFRYDQFGGTSYTVEMITTTCVTLPEYMWEQTSSIKTEGCLILYEFGLCRGSYVRVEAGDHATLPYFRNRAVSYHACSDVRNDQKIEPLSPDGPRIQFFDHYNYNDMIWDTPINTNCTTLPETIRNRTSSIKSDSCVELFSGTDCVGSEFLVEDFLWDNSLEYFQDKLVSFMPCDILHKGAVVTTTTKSLSVETSPNTTIMTNSVTKPKELFVPQHEANSLEIEYHSENSLVLLAAVLLLVVVVVLVQVWICFMYKTKLFIILKRAWSGINTKVDDDMVRFETL